MRTTSPVRFHPYAPRSIRFHGVREHAGWKLKEYAIAYGPATLDWPAFRGGLHLALQALPTAAVAAERPGVALLIAHRGRGGSYVVLGWWDRENELPLRVFVQDGHGWRAGQGGESVCVWDLQVLAAERDAYVDTILAGPDAGAHPHRIAAYLRRHFGPADWQAQRAAYDDDARLTDYVLRHYAHLLDEEERVIERTIQARQKARGSVTDDIRSTGLRWDEVIAHPLMSEGPDAFRRRTRDRLLAEHLDEIELNRCERCDRLVASPAAQQCLWCGNDWHVRRVGAAPELGQPSSMGLG